MALSGEMYPNDPYHEATMENEAQNQPQTREYELSGEAFGEEQNPATVAIKDTLSGELSGEAFPEIESEEPAPESVAEFKLPEGVLQKRIEEAKTQADAELAPEEE